MKVGATYTLIIHSDVAVEDIDGVIVTMKGEDTLVKRYPGDFEICAGAMNVRLTQEETLVLVGDESRATVYLEAQINYKNLSVAKTKTVSFDLDPTLATELVEGNTPDGKEAKDIFIDVVDDVVVAKVDEKSIQKAIDEIDAEAKMALSEIDSMIQEAESIEEHIQGMEQEVIGYRDEAKQAADDCAGAVGAADRAEEAAQRAFDDAVIAESAATRAEEAAQDMHDGKSPYIQGGTWWTYDDYAQEYVDTHVVARGPEGPKGEDAEPYDDTEVKKMIDAQAIINRATALAHMDIDDAAAAPIKSIEFLGKSYAEDGNIVSVTPTLNVSAEDEEVQTVVSPYELRSAGDARDELIVRSDGTGTLTKYIDSVDLGSLDWTKLSTGAMDSSSLIGMVHPPTSSAKLANVYTVAYETKPSTSITRKVRGVGVATNSRVSIYDANYTSPEDFRAAMSGVQLLYERLEPIVIELTSEEVRSILHGVSMFAKTTSLTCDTEFSIEYLVDAKKLINSKLSDFKIDDESVVYNGVAKLWLGNGIIKDVDQSIKVNAANDTDIVIRSSSAFVPASQIDYALRVSMCYGDSEWTDAEKEAAQKRLGVSSGGGGGISYSLEEQDTSITWIDGKKIYQRTVEILNPTVGSTSPTIVRVNHGIQSIENIVDIDGVLFGNTDTYPVGFFSWSSSYISGNGCVRVFANKSEVVYAIGNQLGAKTLYVTLKYTKTA